MQDEHRNLIVASVTEFFETMLAIEAQHEEGVALEGNQSFQDITALIEMSGPVRGAVALSFPAATAISVVNRLLSIESTGLDDMVVDGIAEVVNIIAGSAKPRLAPADGPPVVLGLPAVVQGEDCTRSSESPWNEVRFTSELGPLLLRFVFETDLEAAESETQE
jgi:chemotaxis protein CheX